jgi:hypothetical protein
MNWAIAFVASWILLLLLRRPDKARLAYLGGLLAIIMQTTIDINARHLDLYYIQGGYINLMGSPVCFTLGPVFVMGVLYLQYLPRNKWWQIAHMTLFIALFFVFELALIEAGNLEYAHWNHMGSLFVDVTVFMALSWFGEVFVKEDV